MIVKNEAAVIRRCLESVLPLITHWAIVDTGSTDGTQDIIRTYLRDLPGKLHERPWKDFAYNRSEALALARPLADYSLVIDADDTLEMPVDFKHGPLTASAYTLDIRDGNLVYPRIQLVSNHLTWFYRGVLHEFITANEPHSVSRLGIGMRRNHDGARRQDPSWFQRDIEILQQAAEREMDPSLRSRYVFYLAQSYRDGGMLKEALSHYLERASLGGWQEEVYYSLYQSAKLMEKLDHPMEEIIQTYEDATRSLPSRVEADHWASRLCRVKGFHERGYQIAHRSLGKPYPGEALFGEPWVYEFGLLDEFAVNAYWTGRNEDCLDACLKILAAGRLPANELPRVANNALYAWERIFVRGNTTLASALPANT